LIDFTDISRGDQMRDIGTFLQQLHFMGSQFYSPKETEHLKQYFIEQYFQAPLDSIEQELLDRINLYQAWSSLRGFVYFFFQPDYREKSYGLLEDAWRYLYFAGHSMKTTSLSY
jgi:arginyl-tRNA--protein-N-Asp/Glu arginylyltransferase